MDWLRPFSGDLSRASRWLVSTRARGEQMQDLAQTTLPIGIKLAGRRRGCLDKV